jgi:hypothetical protein
VITGHEVAGPSDDVSQDTADFLEDFVARLPAELPVIGAEVIDVHEDQRQRQAIAARATPFTLEEFQKLLVVGHRGQRIFGAQPLQLYARRFELGGSRVERSLEFVRADRQPPAAGVRPDAECRQGADDGRNERQPLLHSSLPRGLPRCGLCIVGRSNNVFKPASRGSSHCGVQSQGAVFRLVPHCGQIPLQSSEHNGFIGSVR